MTLQWTFVAAFLYVEIAVCLILMIPFISARRWQIIFRSRLLTYVSSYSKVYFNLIICVLGLLAVDGLRETWRFSKVEDDVKDAAIKAGTEARLHMKLFRAQRNLYIAGFAFFLWIVISRLITMISTIARLEASEEASIKQAASATDVAQRLMQSTSKEKVAEVVDAKELAKLKYRLKEKEEELAKAKADVTSMKAQGENLNEEYHRLSDMHNEMEGKYTKLSAKLKQQPPNNGDGESIGGRKRVSNDDEEFDDDIEIVGDSSDDSKKGK